jgi:hypothetical protein
MRFGALQLGHCYWKRWWHIWSPNCFRAALHCISGFALGFHSSRANLAPPFLISNSALEHGVHQLDYDMTLQTTSGLGITAIAHTHNLFLSVTCRTRRTAICRSRRPFTHPRSFLRRLQISPTTSCSFRTVVYKVFGPFLREVQR